jgi:hypothetical protein
MIENKSDAEIKFQRYKNMNGKRRNICNKGGAKCIKIQLNSLTEEIREP